MIEVGEYVRTKQGKIAKLTEINENNYYWFDNWIYKESGIPHQGFRIEDIERIEILKHSKNIIDLIEASDYVNGILIEDIEEIDNKKVFYSNGEMIAWTNRDKGIETILTKEQYIQNCYKIDAK